MATGQHAAAWMVAFTLGVFQFGLLLMLFVPLDIAFSEGRRNTGLVIIMAAVFSIPAMITGLWLGHFGHAAGKFWREGNFLEARSTCLRRGFWLALFNLLPVTLTLGDGLRTFLGASLLDLGFQAALLFLGIGLWLPRNEAERMRAPEP